MIYNVMDYGATGNGVTNDTAAIQAAVNAASAAGGGEVYIPAGSYVVSGDGNASDGCIMLPSNVSVVGAGMGITTVELQSGSSQDISGIFRTQSGVPEANVSMSNLTINGNSANTSGDVYGWFNGVTPEKNNPLDPNEPADTNITLNGVEIENCSGYGFDPHEKTVGLVIENSVSHNNGTDGFTLDGQYDATLTNDVAYDNGRNGFNIVTSSNNITMNNDTAYSNGQDGVMVQRGSNNVPVPFNVSINGGDYHSNAYSGIEIDMANNVTVNGVDINDNLQRGIRIEGSTGTIIENSTLYDDSQAGNGKYPEIGLSVDNDTAGVSGQVYETTGTQIINNTISDDGAVRANASIVEANDGTNNTTVANNAIYGTGDDIPTLYGSNSTYTPPPITSGTTDPDEPKILYAPILGQSNGELMSIMAQDGSSGLGYFQTGLQPLGYSQVVTMTNMAVGGSSVNGDSNQNPPPWWYPKEDEPGPSLLAAVSQMQEQISELGQNGIVTPIVIWSQGEAEAEGIGDKSSALARETAEAQYIDNTLAVFDYIKENVNPNIQFYILETGIFNQTGATNEGYTQAQINMINLGLSYVDDAQIKMALADPNIHLVANYSDLPMNADEPPTAFGYESSWATDPWHLAPTSKEIAADRATGYMALEAGTSHILDNPGPYPIAALADLDISNGSNLVVNDTGDANNAIITDATGRGNHLTGGDGSDTFVIGGVRDIITDGSSSDTIYFATDFLQQIQGAENGTLTDIHNTVNNFKVGPNGDVIDVSALLRAVGYAGSNAVADGYVQFVDTSLGLSIRFDPDGNAGKEKAETIALLSGVTSSEFNIADNLVTQFENGNPVTVNTSTDTASVLLAPVAETDVFTTQVNNPVTGNLMSNNGNGAATDPNGLALGVDSGTFTTAHGGTVVENNNGTFTYTPAAGFTGTDSFNYTLEDSAGLTTAGKANVVVSEAISYTISAPVIQALGGVTPTATLVSSASNTTLDGVHGTYNNVIVASGSGNELEGHDGNDVLIGGTGGDRLYGYNGNDVIDSGEGNNLLNGGAGNDTLISDSGSNTLTGGGGNDMFVFAEAKVAGAYDIITDFNTSINKLNISALLGPNGSAELEAVSGGVGLFIDPNGTGTLTLLAEFEGTCNLTTSTNLNSILTAAVQPHYDPPVAQPDSFIGQENNVITGNLMADNGHGIDTDPNGLSLSVVAATLTTADGGTVVENTDGSFTYTPASGFTGADSFAYTLEDSAGITATGTVSLTVNAPATIPEPVTQALGGVTPTPTLVSTANNTTLDGIHGSYNNVIVASGSGNTLEGHDGNDVLIGGTGGDKLYGYDGNDVIYSGEGNNTLNGGLGNDTLISCSGSNTLTGGGGNDDFILSEPKVLNAYDIITDFNTSDNKLDISALLGTNGTAQLETVSGGTGLYVDSTGTGHPVLVAIFEGTSNVTVSTDLHSILV